MKILTSVLALGLSATGASAATVYIDEFSSDQLVQDVPRTGTTFVKSSQIGDPSVLGGYRDLQVINDEGVEGGTEIDVNGGVLNFNNASNTSGTGFLTYDGNDDPTSVDTGGLGGFDLTYGGLGIGFIYDVLFADLDLNLTVNAWDTEGGFSSFSQTLPAALPAGQYSGLFSQFVGNVDLTKLGALQFVAGGDNVLALDASISSIGVNVVPVPAAGLLLGGVMLAGGAFARRRKAKAV